MTAVFMVLHALVCVLLAIIILMQSGRGGGLTESFASAESMFGAQTNEVLIKATTILASAFLVTCLTLAVLSARKNESLMSGKIAPQTEMLPTIDLTPGSAKDDATAALDAISEAVSEVPMPVVPAAPATVDLPAVE